MCVGGSVGSWEISYIIRQVRKLDKIVSCLCLYCLIKQDIIRGHHVVIIYIHNQKLNTVTMTTINNETMRSIKNQSEIHNLKR